MNHSTNSAKLSSPSPSVSACASSLEAAASICSAVICTACSDSMKLSSDHRPSAPTSSRESFPLQSESISANFSRARCNSLATAASSAAALAALSAALAAGDFLRVGGGRHPPCCCTAAASSPSDTVATRTTAADSPSCEGTAGAGAGKAGATSASRA